MVFALSSIHQTVVSRCLNWPCIMCITIQLCGLPSELQYHWKYKRSWWWFSFCMSGLISLIRPAGIRIWMLNWIKWWFVLSFESYIFLKLMHLHHYQCYDLLLWIEWLAYPIVVYSSIRVLLKISITRVIIREPMKRVMSENRCGQNLHLISVCLVVFQANSNHRNSSIQEI